MTLFADQIEWIRDTLDEIEALNLQVNLSIEVYITRAILEEDKNKLEEAHYIRLHYARPSITLLTENFVTESGKTLIMGKRITPPPPHSKIVVTDAVSGIVCGPDTMVAETRSAASGLEPYKPGFSVASFTY